MWLLLGILLQYAIVIATGEALLGAFARLVLLGCLAVAARFPHADRRTRVAITVAAGVIVLGAGVAVGLVPTAVRPAVVGAASAVLVGLVLASIGWLLIERRVVDRATVIGALCAYLLLAYLFASLHELFSALVPHYLDGTPNPAPMSTLLYFSVITITTVGYGDIAPGANLARAVASSEALIGQLFLVSVVASAIGRSRGRPDPDHELRRRSDRGHRDRDEPADS